MSRNSLVLTILIIGFTMFTFQNCSTGFDTKGLLGSGSNGFGVSVTSGKIKSCDQSVQTHVLVQPFELNNKAAILSSANQFFISSANSIYTFDENRIQFSSDFGQSWVNLNTPSDFVINMVEINNQIYIQTKDNLYPYDGECTVSQIGLVPANLFDRNMQKIVSVVAANNKVAIVVGAISNGYPSIYTTQDAGLNWIKRTTLAAQVGASNANTTYYPSLKYNKENDFRLSIPTYPASQNVTQETTYTSSDFGSSWVTTVADTES